ncbi:MAG: hypothetical protein QHI48_09500 [Bacteroidota bacterium]|nr:hypothetical protein [Bacteroidota bacterium]
MGTQQMLLIVLGVIIVGIAIVVGTIPSFLKGMESSNRDAITQDCLKIAAAAQGYYRRPRLFRGGGNSFENITIRDCGMTMNAEGNGENANGTYSVDGSAGDICIVTGRSKSEEGGTVTVIVRVGAIEPPTFSGW